MEDERSSPEVAKAALDGIFTLLRGRGAPPAPEIDVPPEPEYATVVDKLAAEWEAR